MRYKDDAGHCVHSNKSGDKTQSKVKVESDRLKIAGSLLPASVPGAAALREAHRELQVQEAIGHFTHYLLSERESFYVNGMLLQGSRREVVSGFFAEALLDKVRIVELVEQRVGNPWFYPMAKAQGIRHLPDLAHKASVTFLDVVVFNGLFSERDLFHGLVHAAQIELLGLNAFAEMFVRGFLKSRSYFLVPLKAHAFGLDARFAANPSVRFSVEDEIRDWWRSGKY